LSLRAIVNAGPVGDGQTVWTNIVTEAKKSTTACISSQLLTAYLTTSKIRDGSWRGTDTAYLNHWIEQMCKLVEYSLTTPMTDDFKLTLLKNAVQDAPHLASVESAYDVTTRLGSGAPGAINYNGYMEHQGARNSRNSLGKILVFSANFLENFYNFSGVNNNVCNLDINNHYSVSTITKPILIFTIFIFTVTLPNVLYLNSHTSKIVVSSITTLGH
jgi:hypothetical protein